MQDRHASIYGKNERALSPRSQRLVQHLADIWQNSQEPTDETLKQILVALPEPYRSMSMEAIAERLVNDTKLHFLDIIATFVQKAEQEGIDAEERAETLQDIRLNAYRLMELSKHVLVHTFDDLLKLATITSGLNALSKVQDAESAQSWMYKLPAIYQDRLQQEHLIEERINFSVSFSTENDDLSAWYGTGSSAAMTWRTTKITELHVLSVQVHQSNWTKLLPKTTHTTPRAIDATPTVAG
jgi:hypothetical protein